MMTHFRTLTGMSLLSFGLMTLAVPVSWAEESKSVVSGDNTRVNQRDQNPGELTAIDQSMSESDITITSEIRQGLVKNDNLSTYAHNVKVITQQGKVTLRGPVRSVSERDAVGHIA